jgi:hypothetical protein
MGRPVRTLALFALGYALVLELLLVGAILWWPDFEKNVPALRAMAPMKVLKTVVSELEAGGVFAYVAGQQYFKACNTLGTAAAVLFAVGAVAGEAHRGTLELWLARPYSRARILAERFSVGALALLIPVFATSATIPWLAGFVDEELSLGPLLLCSAHESCLLLAIYAFTFLLSSLGSNPTKIALGVLLVTTFEFAIYMIERVTHWSLYRLSDVPDFMPSSPREASIG